MNNQPMNSWSQQQNANPYFNQGAPNQIPYQNQQMANYGVNYPQPTNYFQNGNTNQAQTLFGRVVNSEANIVPSEVPMDGRISVFPTSDYSRIYVKAWQGDGTIKTVVYTPVIENAEEATSTNSQDEIISRLDKIEKMLSKKPYHKPYNKPKDFKNKAEGGEE